MSSGLKWNLLQSSSLRSARSAACPVIDAVGRNGVVDIHDGAHLATKADRVPRELVRVAGTVEALVVLGGDVERDGADAGWPAGMILLCTTWFFIFANSASVSLAGLFRIASGDAGLADVVQQGAHHNFVDDRAGSCRLRANVVISAQTDTECWKV